MKGPDFGLPIKKSKLVLDRLAGAKLYEETIDYMGRIVQIRLSFLNSVCELVLYV